MNTFENRQSLENALQEIPNTVLGDLTSNSNLLNNLGIENAVDALYLLRSTPDGSAPKEPRHLPTGVVMFRVDALPFFVVNTVRMIEKIVTRFIPSFSLRVMPSYFARSERVVEELN